MLGDDVLPQPYRFVNKVVQRCVERALEEIAFHMSRSPVLDRKYIPPKLTKKIHQNTAGIVITPELLERPSTVSGSSVYPPELGVAAAEAQRVYDQGQIQKKRNLRIKGIESVPTSVSTTPLPHDIGNASIRTISAEGVDSSSAVGGPALYPPRTSITASHLDAPTAIFGLSDGSVQIVNTETQSLLMRTPVLFDSITHAVKYPDAGAVTAAVLAACRVAVSGSGGADQDRGARCQSPQQPPHSSPGGKTGVSPGRTSRNGSKRDATPPPVAFSGRRDSAPTIASPSTASAANPYLPISNGGMQRLTPIAGAGVVSVTGGTPLHAHSLELFAAATAVDGIVVFAVDVDGLAEGPKLQKGGGPLGGSSSGVQFTPTVGVRDAEVKALKDVLSEAMTKKVPQQASEGKQRNKSGSGVSGATTASSRPGMAAASTVMSMSKNASASKRSGGGAPLRDAAPPIELGVVARISHQMLSSAVTAFYDQHPSQHPLTAYYNNVQRTKAAAGSPTSAGATGAANVVSGRSSAGGTEGGLTPRRQKSSNAIATNNGGASLGVQGGAKINGGSGSGSAALEVNMMIPTDGAEAFTKESCAAPTRPVPPPPATPGSFVSSIKLSPDGTFLAVGMDDDATVVVVELFTTSKGDMFGRVPHVVEVVASPNHLCEAVGDMSTPRAHYHFGTLSAPFTTPSHQPQPNPVLEHLRREAKAAQTAATAALATALDGSATLDTSSSVVPQSAGASTPRNPGVSNSTNVEKDRQQKLKLLSDECDAAVLSFDPLPTVSGWLFVGWTGTNSMTRLSLKNTAAVVRSVIFSSIDTLMKSLQPSTADVCLGLVVEETAKVIAASRVDTISQLHSKVNHQLNRAALGPSGTGALSGPSGPVTQDVSLGGAATSKKGGGGGATGVDRPPRGRGGAQNTTASGSQALDGSGATSGPFPVCGDISGVMGGSASSSIATISVAHAVAAAMGVLPPSGSVLVHPISGISMVAALQPSGGSSGARCGSSGSLVGGQPGGGGLPTPPRKDPPSPSQARINPSLTSSISIPQNSRCDLLLPTTLITTTASQDRSLIALCCINGITAVYDTTSLNFKHYFNEMPHRVANRCQRLVAPLQATFQGNRTLTVATITYGAAYRSFVSVFALQPGLAFPPASTSRAVQEQVKRTAGRSAAVVQQEDLQNSSTNLVPISGLLTLESPTRSRHRIMADQHGYLSSLGKHSVHLDSSTHASHATGDIGLSSTLLPTPENHHGSLTPAAAASGVRLCRVPYLDSLEYAVPLGEHLPLMMIKACGGQMLIVDMTEGELVCILNPDSPGVTSPAGGLSAALDAAFGASLSTTTLPKSKVSKAESAAVDTWDGSSIAAAVRCALPHGQGVCWSSASMDSSIHSYLNRIASNDISNLGSHPFNAVPMSLSLGGGDYGTVLQSGTGIPFPTRTGTSAVYSEPITCSAVLQRPQLAQQIASAMLSRSTPQAVASFKNYQGIPILSAEYPHLQRLLSNSTADQVGPLLFVMQHSTRMVPLTPDRVGAAQQTIHFYQQTYFNGDMVGGSEQATHPQQPAGVVSLGALMGSHGSTGGALAAASLWSGGEQLNSTNHNNLSPATTNLSRLPNRSVSKITTGTVDTLGAAPPTPISLDEPMRSTRGGRGGTIRLGGVSPPHSATAMSEPPRSATQTHRPDKHHVVVPQPIPAAETSFKQATLDSLEAQERGRAMRKQRFEATWDRLKTVAPTGGDKPTRNATAPLKQQRM